jgi:hypothetical protein
MLTADADPQTLIRETGNRKGHIMTEQDQTPDIDLEDTEGHGYRKDDEDDTEGHGYRKDDEDDTEGHGYRKDDDDEDDTEGHGYRK